MMRRLYAMSESEDTDSILHLSSSTPNNNNRFPTFDSCTETVRLAEHQWEQYNQQRMLKQNESNKFLQETTSCAATAESIYTCEAPNNHTFVYQQYIHQQQQPQPATVIILNSIAEDISSLNTLITRLHHGENLNVISLYVNYHDPNVTLVNSCEDDGTVELSLQVWKFVLHIVETLKLHDRVIFLSGIGFGSSIVLDMMYRKMEQTRLFEANGTLSPTAESNIIHVNIAGLILLNPWLQFHANQSSSLGILNGRFNDYSSLPFALKVIDKYYYDFVKDKVTPRFLGQIQMVQYFISNLSRVYIINSYIVHRAFVTAIFYSLPDTNVSRTCQE
jgi:hypothetical protein